MAARWTGAARARGSRRRRLDRLRAGHVLDRHLDPQVEGLLRSGIDDRHRARLPPRRPSPSAQVARDLLERSLRRGKPSSGGAAGDLLEPLEREREVRPRCRPTRHGSRPRSTVSTDSRNAAGPRGEDEESDSRRRDEDVGRCRSIRARSSERAPVRIATSGGGPSRRGGRHSAMPRSASAGSARRPPRGLERRDVDDAARSTSAEPGVNMMRDGRGEECRERLARPVGAKTSALSPSRSRPTRAAALSWARRRSRRTTPGPRARREVLRGSPPIIEEERDARQDRLVARSGP